MRSNTFAAAAALTTLGCKVNQYESAAIQETLEARGFTIVPFSAAADVYIISTCTVTAVTNYQSRQLIRRARRTNPDALVVVTGCYAQTSPDEIAAIPGVDVIAGNREKEALPALIEDMVLHRSSQLIAVGDIMHARQIAPLRVTRFPGHTRAFLKIQDGCDAFCSYCIVPYARGPSRSLPAAAVMDGIKTFARAGYREIVLTGIHLGHYGRDLAPAATLLDILEAVEWEKTVERLRLSSIEALEVTDSLIAFMAKAETLCRHLHIPLQSGDDRILELMKRHYETRFFGDLLEKLHRRIPDIAVGIDVMVGFPGEDEEAFTNTRRLIEALPVAYLHVFPYSERPGTEAVKLPGKVAAVDKKRRAEILRTIGKEKRAAFAKGFIGRELAVLVEGGREKKQGELTGFSGNYIPVAIISGGADLANQIIRVIPEYYRDGKLYARRITIE